MSSSLQLLTTKLFTEAGGFTDYTPATMRDELDPHMATGSGPFHYRWKWSELMSTLEIKFNLRDTIAPNDRFEEFLSLLDTWDNLLTNSNYQIIEQWRFHMRSGRFRSTQTFSPGQLDLGEIEELLIDPSGGDAGYADGEQVFQANGVAFIYLVITIIPDADGDGAGRKRKAPPMMLEIFPVQQPRARTGIMIAAPKDMVSKKTKTTPAGTFLKDCGTTEHRRDCGARALAYLFFKQYAPTDPSKNPSNSFRLDLSGSSVRYGPKYANYYNSDSPGVAISKSALKILTAAKLNPVSSINYADMDKFTAAAGALGAHARIHVFKPKQFNGRATFNVSPELLYSSGDPRPTLDLHETRLQNEAEVERCNVRGLFNLKESLSHRPTQHYCLYLMDNHYYAIENSDVHLLFMPRNAYTQFCFRCMMPHAAEALKRCQLAQQGDAKCGSVCINCGTMNCDARSYKDEDVQIFCSSCHINFRTQQCYQLHNDEHKERKGSGRKILHTSSRCKTRFKCEYCGEIVQAATGFDNIKHQIQCRNNHSNDLPGYRCGHCNHSFKVKKDFEKHSCFLCKQSLKKRKLKSSYDTNVIYVDFETYTVEDRKDNGYDSIDSETWRLDNIHKVNLVVCQSADGQCEWRFSTIDAFINWLFDEDFHQNTGGPEGGAKETTLIAHNGRGYDWPVFIAEVHRLTNLHYEIINQGAKVMYLTFTNRPAEMTADDKMFGEKGERLCSLVRFIDSLSFIPRALSSFPKMFGLDSGEKGWWPYDFNKPENFAYVGPIPTISYYKPESFTEDGFISFWGWYVDQIFLTNSQVEQATQQLQDSIKYLEDVVTCKHTKAKLEIFFKQDDEKKRPSFEKPWDFQEMLYVYCAQDVRILRLGFEAFRKFNLNLFPNDSKPYNRGLDPARYVSITSLCLDLYLDKWYKPLSLIPFSYELSEEIRESFHGGRTAALTLLLNLASFLREVNPMPFGRMQRKLSRTQCKIKVVDARSSYPFQCHSRPYPTGMPLIFESAKDFVKYFVGAAHSRLAQWPGNQWSTEAIKAWITEAMELAEAVSWQHVMDTMVLDLLIDHMPNSLSIIKLSFCGPDGLDIPVLPATVTSTETRQRLNKSTGKMKTITTRYSKLIFDLFPHVDQVKTTISLKRARDAGYAFKDVKKIIYWPKDQVVTGLWKDYVDTFYTKKLAAEGWPAGCESDQAKEAYLRKLKRDYPSCTLNKEDIVKNSGRYAMSKLMITSNWGRLVMGSNKGNVTIFRKDNIEEYWKLLRDPTIKITEITALDNDTGRVKWCMKAEHAQLAPKTCVTVGVFTTEWGRDLLYAGMLQVKPEQLLYYDTDSLYYLSDPTQPDWSDIKEGSKLGDWSDDLNKLGTPNDKKQCIVDWWAGSAKNYGYIKAPLLGGTKRRWSPLLHKPEIKVKGFNLSKGFLDSNSAQNQLSYDKCKTRIMDGYLDLAKGLAAPSQPPAEMLTQRFLTAPTMDKQTVMAKQSYRFRYDKRQIAKDLCQIDTVTGKPCYIRTTPFGYKKEYDPMTGKVIIDYGKLLY